MKLNKKKKKLLLLKLAKCVDYALIFVLLFDYLLLPIPVKAINNETSAYITEKQMVLLNLYNNNILHNKHFARLPKNEDREIKYFSLHDMTAYNSEVGQCDDSPCITANGFNVCEHGIEDTVAANFLALGTKVRIPNLFNERVFVVRDRMNYRYQNRMDVWMLNRSDAVNFGLKTAVVEVLE
ncbi:MAG: hypothetical protein ABIA02_01675 [Candidatus Falkowbacteria bacterium]